MKIRQIMGDIWIVETEKGKYIGMIRLDGNVYAAWKDGKYIGSALRLVEAEKLFEESDT